MLLLLVLSASPPTCQGAAQNITAILGARPDLGEFSTLLTSTGLADDINRRSTPVTALAVDNAGMAPLKAQGVPPELVRRSLSVHVLLDYLDDARLQRPAIPDRVRGRAHHAQARRPRAAWGTGMLMVVREPSGVRFDFEPMGNRASWQFAVFVEAVYQAPAWRYVGAARLLRDVGAGRWPVVVVDSWSPAPIPAARPSPAAARRLARCSDSRWPPLAKSPVGWSPPLRATPGSNGD